jgi:hypothetical protein
MINKDIEELINNPNTPKEILEDIYRIDDDFLKYLMLNHPNCPIKILENTIKNENTNYEIKLRIIENPNVTKEILNILQEDLNELVRKNALKKLKNM